MGWELGQDPELQIDTGIDEIHVRIQVFVLHMYAPVKSIQQHQSPDTLSFTCIYNSKK